LEVGAIAVSLGRIDSDVVSGANRKLMKSIGAAAQPR
jgi:hypothetical protein